jgi:outer membrane protein assembly factor BamD
MKFTLNELDDTIFFVNLKIDYSEFFLKINIYLILLSVIFAISCTTKRPDGATEAEILYKEAKDLISKSRYIQASEKLNQIRSQYPYSFYATHAELMQADVLFSQENYAEAASAYILFRDFHPKYSNLGYVIFRISESFYNQLPTTFDRDLTAGVEAIKYYNELLQNYSNTEYVKDARARIAQIEDMVLKKQIYIADFYFKTHDYEAAKSRYQDLLISLTDEKEVARISKMIEDADKKIQK